MSPPSTLVEDSLMLVPLLSFTVPYIFVAVVSEENIREFNWHLQTSIRKIRAGESGGGESGGGESSGGESSGGGERGRRRRGAKEVEVRARGGGKATSISSGLFAVRMQGGRTRDEIWGSRTYGSGYPGSFARGVDNKGFPFYFWPISWGNGTAYGSNALDMYTGEVHHTLLHNPSSTDSQIIVPTCLSSYCRVKNTKKENIIK
ncbi:hypothetical protein B0H14DRAFT_2571115 [Mycena olivaceomarginata]|nr:hypothetical protein B0H14DRAFT_2571115 [Mycena olivaceomarginata]